MVITTFSYQTLNNTSPYTPPVFLWSGRGVQHPDRAAPRGRGTQQQPMRAGVSD